MQIPFHDQNDREIADAKGRLLVARNTCGADPTECLRWLTLEVYETSKADFVAGIRFGTRVAGERCVGLFERLDRSADIEDFFFAFEPYELLGQAQLSVSQSEKSQIALNLYKRFERLLPEILSQVSCRKEPGRNDNSDSDLQPRENANPIAPPPSR